MDALKHSVVINRPVEVMFAFMTKPENELLWRSGLVEYRQTSDSPFGVGTTLRQATQFLGRRSVMTEVVTECEPNRLIASKLTSGFPLRFRVTFEPVEGGTRMTGRISAEAGGFTGALLKLAGPLRRWANGEVQLVFIFSSSTRH
jgi:hypothetical protein